MAHVASCPQCKHDLFVPDDTDRTSWARCPECRAFFELSQVALRELPALLPVEPPQDVRNVPTVRVRDIKAELDIDIESDDSGDELEAAAERIDDWFRSTKTVPDSPSMAEGDLLETLAEPDASEEVPSTPWPDDAESTATFDDPRHMDQLLADIQTPPLDSRPSDEMAPVGRGEPTDYGETIGATEVSDLPVFAKPTHGQPRRKRSAVRTVAAVGIAGVVGSVLGYYALLWLRGSSGDFLNVAQFLPQAILPAELKAKPQRLPMAPLAAADQTDENEAAATTPAEESTEPAEVQATFTTTEDRPVEDSRAADDRYVLETETSEPTDEPTPLDEPPAAAPLADETAVADAARVSGAPTFTADELSASLQAAQEAQPSLTAGDLKDGREVQRAKGYSYSLLADLAQKVTFVDASAGTESVAEPDQAAGELFRLTLSDAHTRSEIAAILPKWIASPNRKHGGIFFAAGVTNPTDARPVTECTAELETGQSLVLLFPATLTEQPEDSSRPVGIVGWIVDQPQEHIAGYTGQAQQAVWVGRFIPLE